MNYLVTSSRAVVDEITNILDFLIEAELALAVQTVSHSGHRISWNSFNNTAAFLLNRGDPSLSDYRHWVLTGAYSAILFDGSLLQITYDVEDREITHHRLAYIPCPFAIDPDEISLMPILDIIEILSEGKPSDVVLRSPIRFDFDPSAANDEHPAAHMTINSKECRIACAGPLHVGRFIDFVFRNFYPNLRRAHRPFFEGRSYAIGGASTLTPEHQLHPHMTWSG